MHLHVQPVAEDELNFCYGGNNKPEAILMIKNISVIYIYPHKFAAKCSQQGTSENQKA
jgi:hypothetical protein